MNENEVCAISLIPIHEIPPDELIFLPCFHRFQKESFLRYLMEREYSCPVCKVELSPSMFGIEEDEVREVSVGGESIRSGEDEEESDGSDSEGSLVNFVVADEEELTNLDEEWIPEEPIEGGDGSEDESQDDGDNQDL